LEERRYGMLVAMQINSAAKKKHTCGRKIEGQPEYAESRHKLISRATPVLPTGKSCFVRGGGKKKEPRVDPSRQNAIKRDRKKG